MGKLVFLVSFLSLSLISCGDKDSGSKNQGSNSAGSSSNSGQKACEPNCKEEEKKPEEKNPEEKKAKYKVEILEGYAHLLSNKNAKLKLSARVFDENKSLVKDAEVTWQSSEPSAVPISSDGEIELKVFNKSAKITAEYKDAKSEAVAIAVAEYKKDFVLKELKLDESLKKAINKEESAKQTDNTLVFDGSHPSLKGLKKGDYLKMEGDYLYVGKVKEVKDENGKKSLLLQQAQLTEVYKNLDIDIEYLKKAAPKTSSSPFQILKEKNIGPFKCKLEDRTFFLKWADAPKFRPKNSIFDFMSLEKRKFIKIELFTLKEFNFVMNGNVLAEVYLGKLQMDFLAQIKGSCTATLVEPPIPSYVNLIFFGVGFNVPLNFVIDFIFDPVSSPKPFAITYTLPSYDLSFDYRFGVSYKDGPEGMKLVNESKKKWEKTKSSEFGLNIQEGFKPKIELKFSLSPAFQFKLDKPIDEPLVIKIFEPKFGAGFDIFAEDLYNLDSNPLVTFDWSIFAFIDLLFSSDLFILNKTFKPLLGKDIIVNLPPLYKFKKPYVQASKLKTKSISPKSYLQYGKKSEINVDAEIIKNNAWVNNLKSIDLYMKEKGLLNKYKVVSSTKGGNSNTFKIPWTPKKPSSASNSCKKVSLLAIGTAEKLAVLKTPSTELEAVIGPECALAETLCMKPDQSSCLCADLKVDAKNCGKCENQCKAEKANCCEGSCVDFKNHKKNCGSCKNACKSGEDCQEGKCQKDCKPGTFLENGQCVTIGVKSCKAHSYYRDAQKEIGLSGKNWCGDIKKRFSLVNKGNDHIYDSLLKGYWSKWDGKVHKWSAAKLYCKGLGNGYVLPPIQNLVSLYSEKKDPNEGYINPVFSDADSQNYWSITLRAISARPGAYTVNFASGYVGFLWTKTTGTSRVWCFRSGP